MIFAVANRHFVTVSFDPFNSERPSFAVTLPLFVLIIAVAILGVLAGGWRPGSASGAGGARRASMRRMPAAPGPNWPICGPQAASARPEPAAPSRALRGWAFTGPPGETSRARRCRTPPPTARFQPRSGGLNLPFETMSLLVKICGLSTRETLDAALQAGADMVGFVFFPPSPRHLGLEPARELGRQAKGRAVKVALTVDADDATLDNIIEALRPDILQLHGKETIARLRDIKQKFGLPVMKAMAVETAGRSRRAARLCRGRRSHPVRCPRAEGRHPSRRAGRGVRLASAGKSRSQAAVHGLGRA